MGLDKWFGKVKDIWKNHKPKIVIGLIFEAALCLVACWFANPVWFSTSKLTIFSATTGGEWKPIGDKLAEVLKQKNVGSEVEVADDPHGSLGNIEALRNGSAQLAYVAELPTDDPKERLWDISAIRQVLRLQPSYLHIICLSRKFGKTPTLTAVVEKIKKDSKNDPAKVYLGKELSGTRQLAEIILRYYGVHESDYIDSEQESSFSEAADALAEDAQAADALAADTRAGDALQSKKLDIAFFLVRTQADALERLAKGSERQQLSYVEIDRADGLAVHYPELDVFLMPKHVFSGSYTLPAREVKTLKCGQILACPSNLRSYLVKRIAEVAYETGDYQSPFMTGTTAADRHKGYPCHPGTLAFEKGERFGGIRGTVLGTIITIMFAPIGLLISATLGKWPAKNYQKYIDEINKRRRELKQNFPGALEKFKKKLSAIQEECLREYTEGRLSRDGYLRVRECATAFNSEEGAQD